MDLISRNNLREVLESIDWYSKDSDGKLMPGAVSGDNAYFPASEVFAALEAAVAIDPGTVRHGFWVMEHFSDGRVKSCRCSECKANNYMAPPVCYECLALMDKKLKR